MFNLILFIAPMLIAIDSAQQPEPRDLICLWDWYKLLDSLKIWRLCSLGWAPEGKGSHETDDHCKTSKRCQGRCHRHRLIDTAWRRNVTRWTDWLRWIAKHDAAGVVVLDKRQVAGDNDLSQILGWLHTIAGDWRLGLQTGHDCVVGSAVVGLRGVPVLRDVDLSVDALIDVGLNTGQHVAGLVLKV